jgi:hypothetical protein
MLQRALGELEREPHVTTVTFGPLSRSDTLDLVRGNVSGCVNEGKAV